MDEAWLKQFEAWHDFYVIVGSSAAGLTGLMFVVVSLGPNIIGTRGHTGVRAFVTPTVLFFATVLVIAAFMTVPTMRADILAGILALGSIGGFVYMITRRGHQAWRQSTLDFMDWIWYVGLPILCYLLLLGAAVIIGMQMRFGMETVGAAVILLLVVGIRNAWDLVLWMAQQARSE